MMSEHTAIGRRGGAAGAVRIAGFGLLLLSSWFSLHLPVRISWENGPLESLQVVVLAALVVHALACRRREAGPGGRVWLGAACIWFLLLARELSWGAVFLEPVRITDHGPAFSSALLWYRPAVTPGIAAVLALALWWILRGHPGRFFRLLASRRGFPLLDVAGFVGAMLVSTASEGHMGMSLGGWPGDPQVLEETVELAAYIFLLSGQMHVFRRRRERDGAA